MNRDTIPPGRWQKFRGCFFRRVPECCQTPRWMGLAYRDAERMDSVMVAWPLNYVARSWWWLGWRWDGFRHRRSWIDRLQKAAYEKGRAEGKQDEWREIQRAMDKFVQ